MKTFLKSVLGMAPDQIACLYTGPAIFIVGLYCLTTEGQKSWFTLLLSLGMTVLGVIVFLTAHLKGKMKK